MPRFDPAGYPGPRPDGPCLVRHGEVVPLVAHRVGESTLHVDHDLPDDLRWTFAYGSNACPDRLVDKGVDKPGAVLLPARLPDHVAAWEARRSPTTGAVPVTLLRRVAGSLAGWLLGVDPVAAEAVDRSESRGDRYVVGLVGPVAVCDLVTIPTVAAYGPGRGTRVLLDGDRPATWPERDQAWARRQVEAGAAVAVAPPLDHPVDTGFPTRFRLVSR